MLLAQVLLATDTCSVFLDTIGKCASHMVDSELLIKQAVCKKWVFNLEHLRRAHREVCPRATENSRFW